MTIKPIQICLTITAALLFSSLSFAACDHKKMTCSKDNDPGEQAVKDIKAHCSEKWHKDYRMQKYCINKQAKSTIALSQIYNKYAKGSEERSIVTACVDKWRDKNKKPDWRMALYCSKKQISAYHEIHS